MSFFEFLQQHFTHVLPVILCGVFALAVVIERSRALFKVYPMKQQGAFFARVSDLVSGGHIEEAVSLCDQYPKKPLANLVKAALLRAHLPEDLIYHGVEMSVNDAHQSVNKRTAFLATVANVATLLGLFGTILGLVSSFEAVGHADAQQKSTLLAAGIAMALNATMMGLGVAIPAMVAFAFLMNRSNQLIAELDNASVRIVDILQQRYFAAEHESLEAGAETGDPEAPTAANGNGTGESAKVVKMRRSA